MIIVFSILILVMSVVIHEVSHGYAAYLQGDMTAQYEGRLTLNPLKHIDPIGSILVPYCYIYSWSAVWMGKASAV
jgi:Zn-dependent protease